MPDSQEWLQDDDIQVNYWKPGMAECTQMSIVMVSIARR